MDNIFACKGGIGLWGLVGCGWGGDGLVCGGLLLKSLDKSGKFGLSVAVPSEVLGFEFWE